MNQNQFEQKMRKAQVLARLQDSDYWAGYHRGLRRLFHGERFGTPAEHEKWLALSDDRERLGQGFRDGFAGK